MREAIAAVGPGQKVAWKTATGIGKTEFGAGLTLWWTECFDENLVLTTGSSWASLKNILWPRVHKFIGKYNLFDPRLASSLKIQLGAEYGRAIAGSPREPEKIAGTHARYLFQVVEEASGITREVADAIDGNDTGEFGAQLWLGNPLRAKGEFYDRCHKDKTFKVFEISALDHPNVIEGREIIPGAVSRKKVHERAEKLATQCDPHTSGAVHLFWLGDEGWYLPSGRFNSRVLGKEPSQEDDSLISDAMMDDAIARPAPKDDGQIPIGTGCDIARFGSDNTVIVDVCDRGVLSIEKLHGKRTTDTAGRLTARYRERKRSIATDDAGVGGGVTDTLVDNGIPVLPVDFGSAADGPDNQKRYANLKAQIYWEFKEEVENNPDFHLPDDEDLRDEATTIRYGHDRHGRVQIESKDEYRKRTGKSPDTLEAVLIALYALKRNAVQQFKFGSIKRRENFRALGIGHHDDDE